MGSDPCSTRPLACVRLGHENAIVEGHPPAGNRWHLQSSRPPFHSWTNALCPPSCLICPNSGQRGRLTRMRLYQVVLHSSSCFTVQPGSGFPRHCEHKCQSKLRPQLEIPPQQLPRARATPKSPGQQDSEMTGEEATASQMSLEIRRKSPVYMSLKREREGHTYSQDPALT